MTTHDQFFKDFEQFLDEMRQVLKAKNHDYTGASKDPLYNFRKADDMGIVPWKGALLRFSDKFSRLQTFAKKESFEVKDENVYDTLIDGANYLFLIAELYKESQNAKHNQALEGGDRPSVVAK